MNTPRILNLRIEGTAARSNRKNTYIGRPAGDHDDHFGNPFSHLPGKAAVQVKDRPTALKYFDQWLDGTAHQDVDPTRRLWILANLHLIRESDAVLCWCAPAECHGESLVARAFPELPQIVRAAILVEQLDFFA
jgi:hypothetical protein